MPSNSIHSYSSASTYHLPNTRKLEDSNRPDYCYKLPKSSESNHTKFIREKYNDNLIDGLLPFVTNDLINFPNKLSFIQKVELSFTFITLFFPRLFLYISTVILLNILGFIGTLNLPEGHSRDESPIQPDILGWRRVWLGLMLVVYRINQFALGIWWINIKGRPCRSDESIIHCVAPHSTVSDGAMVSVLSPKLFPFALSPVSTNSFKLLNGPLRMLHPIFVSRENMKSRRYVVEEINKRVQEVSEKGLDWQKFIIFPEGGMGNRQAFQTFKPGAFIPGQPIQPIYLEIKNPSGFDIHSFNWIPLGNAIKVMLNHMLTLRLSYTIHFLPVYKPSEEEIIDPHLYAWNLRAYMSKYAKIPCLDTAHEDGLLSHHFAEKYKGNPARLFVKTQYLIKTYGVRFREIRKIFDEYMKCYLVEKNLVIQETGSIKLEDFAREVGINSKLLKNRYFYDFQLTEIDDRAENIQSENEIINPAVYLEAYFRASDCVSIAEIMNLNIREIITAADIDIDKFEDFDHFTQNDYEFIREFVQANPYYLVVRKNDEN